MPPRRWSYSNAKFNAEFSWFHFLWGFSLKSDHVSRVSSCHIYFAFICDSNVLQKLPRMFQRWWNNFSNDQWNFRRFKWKSAMKMKKNASQERDQCYAIFQFKFMRTLSLETVRFQFDSCKIKLATTRKISLLCSYNNKFWCPVFKRLAWNGPFKWSQKSQLKFPLTWN